MVREEKKQREMQVTARAVQYLMLTALLLCALILPPIAGRERQLESAAGQKTVRMDAQSRSIQEWKTKENAAGTKLPEKAGARGTIVIDAGHGGDDPGMLGASGLPEKGVNLACAKKLGKLLEEAGFRVVQTRTDEGGLYDADARNKKAQDMRRRVELIEREQPLLAVSLHQNSYPDPSVRGPQVFFYEGASEGELLAKTIQEHLNEELAIARPRVQKGNSSYYILKHSSYTTVIVECGFLSNPEEEAKLQTEEYQEQVMKAVCNGILSYLEERNS